MEGRIRSSALLTAIIFIAFFVRAIPHLFLIPIWVSEEQTTYVILENLIKTGQPLSFWFQPHCMHYILYGGWLLTKLNPITLVQYSNPIIGALTIVPLFFLLKKLNVKTAYLGCLLFAFAESQIYRSAYSGTTEPLGFMFGLFAFTFMLYGYLFLVPIFMGLAFFSHLLPPIVFIAMIILCFLVKDRSKGSLIVSTILIFEAWLFIFSPLMLHQGQSSNLASLTSTFQFNNMQIYSFQELLKGLWLFVSCTILGLLAIFKKPKRIPLIVTVIGFFCVIAGWLTYNMSMIGPARLMMYFNLGLILWVVMAYSKRILKFIVFVVVMMSLIAMVTCGFQQFLWVNDSLTMSEWNAINWAEENGCIDVKNNTDFWTGTSKWWGDSPIRVEISSRSPKSYLDVSSPINVTVGMYNLILNVSLGNATISEYNKFNFALYSERMQKQAFFRIYKDKRVVELRFPILDPFENRTDWQVIYNHDGVKIYEKAKT